MKKGLLSILAGALVVVGCQNYDDQFDNLESQISALASTVAGLSQVQSDLASLAGTVSSLQSSLSSQIDSSLADGLADIDAAVENLEAATADAASAEDVAAIQAGIDANAADLDELLAQASIFQGHVTINSKATLDVYHAMGDQLAIVNGNVDIDAKADMDATKLQETVNNILTTVGSFDFQADSASVATVTFLNLTGTQTLTIKQAGDYRFDNLTSATNVQLLDQFKSKVNIIHFGSLTSVSKFFTDTASSNLIDFNKVNELHLTSLAYYPPNNLTVRIDEESVFATAIDDVDADGDQTNITLSIEGPSTFTASNLKDGSLTFKNVETVTVNGFEGSFTIQDGVENFNADKVTAMTISGATDLANLNITGALDPDVSSDKTGPEVTIEDNANIETVTLAGKVDDVILEGNGNLTSVTISAEVDGKINIGDDDAPADGNSDLTSVTLTGAKATSIEIANNSDLETLTVDLAFIAGSASGAKLDGELIVVNNTSLTSLTVSSDKIETLTVTGNDDLSTVDFTGLATIGATGEAEVNIWDNDLEGALTDNDDGDTNIDNGKSGDLGSISSSSGIATLKTYLTAVAADSDSTAKVLMDTVDFTNESDTTTEYVYATSADAASEYLRIAYFTPQSSDGGAATKQKRAFILKGGVAETFGITVNSTELFLNSGTPGNITMDGNADISIAKILDSAHIARATAAGVTMTAEKKGNAKVDLVIVSEKTSSLAETTAAKATTTEVGSGTIITLTVGPHTVTTTIAAKTSNASTIATALQNAYNTVTSTIREVVITGNASNGSSSWAGLVLTAADKGSDGAGLGVSISLDNDGTVSTTTDGTGQLGYYIGDTRSTADNMTKGGDIVLTIENNDPGTVLNNIGAQSAGFTSATIFFSGAMITSPSLELHSTLQTVSKTKEGSAANNTYPSESRSDVRIAEEAIAPSSDAVSYSRIGWL